MRLFKLLLLLAAILFAACHSQSFKDGASAQSGKAAGDSLPLVTDDGIGRLVLGTPLVNCLTAGGRLAPTADTLAYGFYNHVAVELTDEEGGRTRILCSMMTPRRWPCSIAIWNLGTGNRGAS